MFAHRSLDRRQRILGWRILHLVLDDARRDLRIRSGVLPFPSQPRALSALLAAQKAPRGVVAT